MFEFPRNVTVVAVLEVEVFREITAPSGANMDTFQHAPLQLGKVTSNATVPLPIAFNLKWSLSVASISCPTRTLPILIAVADATESLLSDSAASSPDRNSPLME